MRDDSLPMIAIAAFLAVAGMYHLLAPAQSERLFSRVGPVRVIGIILSVLGVWCLLFPTVTCYLVGIPTLLSGLARFAAPVRTIAINTWTSRYMHGVIMLVAAVICVLLLHFA